MTSGAHEWRRWSGLVIGPALFVVLLLSPAPEGLAPAGWRVAAVAVLMAVWWITEAIPLAATSLVPLALFPLLRVGSIEAAAAPYANPLIFLFLGGFLLALAVERWGLHRRIALRIISAVGVRPRRIVLGFMVAAAFLSMWISNTAAALLLFPIGMSVITLSESDEGPEARATDPDFAPALLIGIAFAASLGGLGTLIGTPPNALTAAFLLEAYEVRIGFARWMLLAVPVLLVALPLAFIIITRVALPVRTAEIPGGRKLVEEELARLGPFSRGERLTAAVFLAAAVLWMTRPFLGRWVPGLTDAGIAIGAGLLLFLLPVDARRGVFVLDWPWARRLPWDILILFGGGLSLAAAIESTGLATWMAGAFGGLSAWPALLVLGALVATVIAFSELASNTATAAAFLPVVGALAGSIGREPVFLVITAGLAASGGFMLPVATPPNAIVYGSGRITVAQLARAGALLDLLFVVLVPVGASVLVPWALG